MLTAPESLAWSGQPGIRCMELNARDRRDIDDASRVDGSSIFLQKGGQAENDEYPGAEQDSRHQHTWMSLDTAKNLVSKAIAANENEHER